TCDRRAASRHAVRSAGCATMKKAHGSAANVAVSFLRIPEVIMSTFRPGTLAVHTGNEADPATGAVAPPIHLATTFRHGPDGSRVAGYEYQREGNPTNDRL